MVKGKRAEQTGGKPKRAGRKSKAESMTGAKENTVETRKVTPVQLEMNAPIESKPGQFRSYYNRAKSDHDLFTKFQGRYRETIKEAKESNPLLAEAVKLAIKLVDEDGAIDHEAIRGKLRMHGFVLQEFGSTLQLTLHDTALGDEKDLAYKRGFEIGTEGKAFPMEEYPRHSDLNDVFHLGWHNGQLKNMKLPYGETRATAVQRIEASKDDVDEHPDPDEMNDVEGDPIAEPMPERELEALH